MDIKGLIYRAKWRLLRPRAFAAYARLVANERRGADELAAEQEAARQAIVREAMTHVPFYRVKYAAAGFRSEEIGAPGWFERLPIVTKADLREHFDDFFDPALRRFAGVSTTGGSTGVPTRAGYDRRLPKETYAWRLQAWFGVKPWDHLAYAWRDTNASRWGRFKNAALWWPTRHLKLDASFMSEPAIDEFLTRYAKLKPALLYGYVGAITQLAERVVSQGWTGRVANPNLKVVWVTSAPLSAVQRAVITRAFGAKVCDQYGCCEIHALAQQCAAGGGLHVNTERVHIEFVDEANRPVPKGVYGRTLLTNLEDRVFPLIRYENGDRGRWLTEPCVCGRPHPCIDSVKGRESESFALPDGRTVNGEYLTTIFDTAPELVRGFRVVQHADLSITVEYVPSAQGGTTEEAGVNVIAANFRKAVGGAVPVTFKAVETIPHDRGKLRFVVREDA